MRGCGWLLVPVMNEMPYRCLSCLCPSRSECHRWHELGERRGVLLVQLPPDQERDDDRLDYFLRGLPEWMRVAVELRHHS